MGVGLGFIIRYGLMWLWSLRNPAICCLQSWRTRKASGVVLRPERLENQCCRFQSGSEGLRTRNTKGKRRPMFSSCREQIQHFVLLFSSAPQQIGGWPPTLGSSVLAQSLALFLHSAPIFVRCPFVNIPSSNYPHLSAPSVFLFWDPNGRMWFATAAKRFWTRLPTQLPNASIRFSPMEGKPLPGRRG